MIWHWLETLFWFVVCARATVYLAHFMVALAPPEVSDIDTSDDFAKSYEECLRAVRERVKTGGEPWQPK